MDKKKKFGQFYTTNASYIVSSDLLEVFPEDCVVIDPFAGKWDLLNLLSNHKREAFDIDPKNKETTLRDTLLNPPSYSGKWILTNPPYLAKNKNKNKSIYDLYSVSDLYKAAIKTSSKVSGGIFIVPLNFFCDEDESARIEFLKKFEIKKIRVFEEQVFDDTSYTICAFSFSRANETLKQQKLTIEFLPSGEKKSLNVSLDSGYRVGYEFFKSLEEVSEVKISRLLKRSKRRSNLNISLRAIDTGSKDGRIKLEYDENHYYGKDTDRTFASLECSKFISERDQKRIIKEFNDLLESYRDRYHSLFLTNFRNSTSEYARKRISFDVAYKLVRHVIKKLNIDCGELKYARKSLK